MTAEENREITRLYRSMYKMLIKRGMKYFNGNESLAEEAVQETFRIACTKVTDVCGSPNPEGWIALAFQNVVRNVWRERAAASKLMDLFSEENLNHAVSEDRVGLRILYGDVVNTEEYKLVHEMICEGKSHLEMAPGARNHSGCLQKTSSAGKRIFEKKVFRVSVTICR